jgi:hypothetical protein
MQSAVEGQWLDGRMSAEDRLALLAVVARRCSALAEAAERQHGRAT